MDQTMLEMICKNVFRQNREFSDVTPKISTQPNGQYVLTFQKKVATANGHSMERILRVTTDARGKILKTSTSR